LAKSKFSLSSANSAVNIGIRPWTAFQVLTFYSRIFKYDNDDYIYGIIVQTDRKRQSLAISQSTIFHILRVIAAIRHHFGHP
jgi:hypothetical protein